MIPLIRKYLPHSTKDIIGQKAALERLDSFVSNYKKQKKKIAIIYGPTGIGKTSSVYALAKDHNLEIFELNASDFRNKEQINAKLGSSMKQMSLFSIGKIILIDDIDGLAGNEDRGGLPAIMELIQDSHFPVVATAVNPYDQKFSSLRSKAELIEFSAIGMADMVPFLDAICKTERLPFKEEILKAISRRSGGDLRAALNDLEILSSLADVTKESLDDLGMREREESIIEAIMKIFKTTDPKIAISAFDYVTEDLDQQMLWLDENLPKEYEKAEDLARAYRNLSEADIYNARIRRWQHWHFLVYINALITAGVAVSKDQKYNKFVEYKPTGRILKLWWAKQKSMKKKSIAAKIATNTHTSQKEIIKSMPYYQYIFKKDKKMSEMISQELKLDAEEVEWLKK